MSQATTMADRSESGTEDPPWAAKGADALAAFDRDIGLQLRQLQLSSLLISFGLHLTLGFLLVKGFTSPAFDKGPGDDVLKGEAAAIAVEIVTADDLPWPARHPERQTEARKTLPVDQDSPGAPAIADEPPSPPQSAAAQEATAPPQPATTAAAEPSAGPQIDSHRAVVQAGGNATMFSAYLGAVHARIERTNQPPHANRRHGSCPVRGHQLRRAAIAGDRDIIGLTHSRRCCPCIAAARRPVSADAGRRRRAVSRVDDAVSFSGEVSVPPEWNPYSPHTALPAGILQMALIAANALKRRGGHPDKHHSIVVDCTDHAPVAALASCSELRPQSFAGQTGQHCRLPAGARKERHCSIDRFMTATRPCSARNDRQALTVRGVSHRFGRTLALDDVSLDGAARWVRGAARPRTAPASRHCSRSSPGSTTTSAAKSKFSGTTCAASRWRRCPARRGVPEPHPRHRPQSHPEPRLSCRPARHPPAPGAGARGRNARRSWGSQSVPATRCACCRAGRRGGSRSPAHCCIARPACCSTRRRSVST